MRGTRAAAHSVRRAARLVPQCRWGSSSVGNCPIPLAVGRTGRHVVERMQPRKRSEVMIHAEIERRPARGGRFGSRRRTSRERRCRPSTAASSAASSRATELVLRRRAISVGTLHLRPARLRSKASCRQTRSRRRRHALSGPHCDRPVHAAERPANIHHRELAIVATGIGARVSLRRRSPRGIRPSPVEPALRLPTVS